MTVAEEPLYPDTWLSYGGRLYMFRRKVHEKYLW